MTTTVISTAILLFASTYLVVWLLKAFLEAWSTYKQREAKILSARLQPLQEKAALRKTGMPLWILPITFLVGGALAWLFTSLLYPVVLLAALLIFALVIEEMHEPRRLKNLPATLGLLEGLRSEPEKSNLFLALENVSNKLPAGLVRDALQTAIQKNAGGEDPEKSLQALKGINPFLDEFVSDLRNAGWQFGPTLDTALALLLRRAAAEWDTSSQSRALREKTQRFFLPGRAAILGSIATTIVIGFGNNLKSIMEGIKQPTILGITVILVAILGVFLHSALTRPWLRRSLATALFILALLFLVTTPYTMPVHAQEATVTATITQTATPPLPPDRTATSFPTITPPSPPIEVSATPVIVIRTNTPTSQIPRPSATAPAVPIPSKTSIPTEPPPPLSSVTPSSTPPIILPTNTLQPSDTPEPPSPTPPVSPPTSTPPFSPGG